MGVASGLYKFATEKPEIVTDSLKLKTNRLLNTAGEAHHQPHSSRMDPRCTSLQCGMGLPCASQLYY